MRRISCQSHHAMIEARALLARRRRRRDITFLTAVLAEEVIRKSGERLPIAGAKTVTIRPSYILFE